MAESAVENPLSNQEPKPNESLITPEGRNAKNIYCIRCNCLILKPQVGTLVEKEIYLSYSKKSAEGEQGETLLWFWKVQNMLDFENIGFSNTVDSLEKKYKYLTCADCELDILGKQWLEEEDKDMYLSCSRVKYE